MALLVILLLVGGLLIIVLEPCVVRRCRLPFYTSIVPGYACQVHQHHRSMNGRIASMIEIAASHHGSDNADKKLRILMATQEIIDFAADEVEPGWAGVSEFSSHSFFSLVGVTGF